MFIFAAQKMKFSIKNLFSKCDQIHSFPEGLVTSTEEILNGKLHFLYGVQLNILRSKTRWLLNSILGIFTGFYEHV